jgi:hypothetical protein
LKIHGYALAVKLKRGRLAMPLRKEIIFGNQYNLDFRRSYLIIIPGLKQGATRRQIPNKGNP